MKRSAGGATRAISSGFRTALGGLLTFAAGAAALRFMTKASMEQEQAEMDLAAALEMTGDASTKNIESMKKYASGIQELTIYGDELLLSQMAYAKNLGVTTNQLQDATTAAVGLAAGYKLDLATAMMLVGRASKGQTQMLTRYGIQLDDTLSPQEKFNRLLEIGAEKFVLAERAAESTRNSIVRLKAVIGDIAEDIADPLLPIIKELSVEFKDLLKEKQPEIQTWVDNWVEGLQSVYWAANELYQIQVKLSALIMPEWMRGGPYRILQRQALRAAEHLDKMFYEGGKIFPEHKTQYIEGGLPSMRGQLAAESEEAALNKRLQEVYKTDAEKSVGPTELSAEEKAKLKKEAEEFAYQRTRITAQMYSDMSGFGDDYYKSQVALIDQQKKDYDFYINDKALLDEWYTAKVNDLALKTSGFWRETTNALQESQNALSDYFMEFENFEDVIDSVGRSFQRMFANLASQMAMFGAMSALVGGPMAGAMGFSNPMAGAGNVVLGGLLGGILGGGGGGMITAGGSAAGGGNPYFLATGGVIDRGRIVPMADGDILNSPTYFPLAGGNTGLMGEAGPEAAVPLKRMRGGRLGVETDSQQSNRPIQVSVKAIIVDDKRKALIEELKGSMGEEIVVSHILNSGLY